MIFNLEKTYPDGRTLNYHRIDDHVIDMVDFTVIPIIKSWETEAEAFANAPNCVKFTARIPHAYWSENNVQDLESKVMNLEWTPVDVAYQQPLQITLEEAKSLRKKLMNEQRDLLEKSGFQYLGKTIESDMQSVARITAAAQTAQIAIATSTPFELEWTCQDNTTLTLTAEQMVGMVPALAMYANELHIHAKDKKALIDAALTIEEVESIVW